MKKTKIKQCSECGNHFESNEYLRTMFRGKEICDSCTKQIWVSLKGDF